MTCFISHASVLKELKKVKSRMCVCVYVRIM